MRYSQFTACCRPRALGPEFKLSLGAEVIITVNIDPSKIIVSGRRILCSAHSGDGHSIPVLNLACKLRGPNQLVMISRSERTSRLAASHNIPCISRIIPTGVAYDPFSELPFLQSNDPDITIVDYDLVMWILFRVWRPLCTVSILRSELLLQYQRRNIFLPDKFGFFDGTATRKYNAILRQHECPPVSDARELFLGDIVIIPSIPELEPLSEATKECYPNTEFVYTGPLFMPAEFTMSESLNVWLADARQSGAPIAMITLGTIWGADIYEELLDCFKGSEFAVVVVIPQENIRSSLSIRNNPSLHVTGFVDVATLANNVDIIIHHCGHGTLQTAIMAGKPSLTLPSGEYDREDNALRMQDLGCGRHLGHDFFRRGLRLSRIAKIASQLIRNHVIHNRLSQLSSIMIDYVDDRGFRGLKRAFATRIANLTNTNAMAP